MRTIKYTNCFKRDYRREKSGVLGKKLDKLLMEAINLLAADQLLRDATSIIPLSVSGKTTATATSGPISC